MWQREMEKVYFIVLNYNGKENTRQCIQALLECESKNYEIRILTVDNASTDGSEEYLKELFGKEIDILQTKKNLGYAGGNNAGIRYALRQGANYICIMNNDIIVKESFLDECIEVLKRDTKAAIVAPGIANYYTEICDNTGANIDISKGKATFLNRGKKKEEIPELNIICDMVEGSCILFDAGIVKTLGLLPEAYFMYYEETEWCYRAKKKRFHCVSVPKIWVYHKKRESIKDKDGFFEYMMERNRVVFVKRNATVKEKIIFSVYLVYRTIQLARVNKKSCLTYLRMYMDGFLNRKSKTYPFVYIPK